MHYIIEYIIFVSNFYTNSLLMKKFLLLIIFIFSFTGFSSGIKGQIKEPASFSQKSDDGVLTAYPNPAKDFLMVKAKDSGLKIKTVSFYSILGTQVANYVINSNSAEINIQRLKPGKYLIRYILSDNTQKVTQIVKQ